MLEHVSQLLGGFADIDGSISIPDYDHVGRIAQSTSQDIIYHNGKTFASGNKVRSTNHQGIIVEYDGVNTPIWSVVGTGTDTQDISNHPRLVLEIGLDNHIYCYRTNPHISVVVIYKSVTAETIADGFVEHARTTLTPTSYPNVFKGLSGQLNLFMRSSTLAGAQYSLSILLASDPTNDTYTEKRITSTAGSSRRHYPQFFKSYGTNTKMAFGLNTRKLSGDVFYANQALFTSIDQSFDVWENYNGSFSKDITASGTLTATELTNFVINGDPTNDTLDIGFAIGALVNDDLFMIDGKFTNLKKITSAGFTNISLSSVGINKAYNLYSDSTGSKIIIQCFNGTPGNEIVEFWTCTPNLTDFKKAYDLSFSADINYNLPANYDQIPEGNKYMIAGGNVVGTMNYRLTDFIF